MNEQTIGKYIIEHNGTRKNGLSAVELHAMLESEAYADAKVYKVHSVRPDGTVELKGMPREIFELESGMFFHASDSDAAEQVYNELASLSDSFALHCKCVVSLSKAGQRYVTSVIYPAEFEDEISAVLLENDLRFDGAVSGGVQEVAAFYSAGHELLKSTQAVSGVSLSQAGQRSA